MRQNRLFNDERGQTTGGAYLDLITYIIGTVLFIIVISAVWAVMWVELDAEAADYNLGKFGGGEALFGIAEMLNVWIPITAIIGAILIGIVVAYRKTRVTGVEVRRRR